jgi:predicted alpha/beta superfamily hydrolase
MSLPVRSSGLLKHERFHSEFLPDDRDIDVFLPPGYDAAADRRFPVLYLHDGQNLFDPAVAFGFTHWRVGETANALIDSARIEPLIIVGIHNTGRERIHEYTPTHDRKRGGGKANDYGRMLVEEIKPFIDRSYRTLVDAANTGLGGSSLGALVSLYLGLQYPNVFGKLALLSPSVWWDRRAILGVVRRTTPRPPTRIWLDMGTAESGRAGSAQRVLDDTRLLHVALNKAGWIDDVDLHYEEVIGGTHSERAWSERFGHVLEFLFPRRRQEGPGFSPGITG